MALVSLLLAVMMQTGLLVPTELPVPTGLPMQKESLMHTRLFAVEVRENVPYAQKKGFWCSSSGRDDNFFAHALKLPKAWWERDLTLTMDIYLPQTSGNCVIADGKVTEDADIIENNVNGKIGGEVGGKACSKVSSKVGNEVDSKVGHEFCCHNYTIARPLVMLLHGGAFFANSKTSEPVSSLCRTLAENGFVAASVDYRMGFNLHKKSVQRAADYALEDASSALHFLVANACEFGIDTSKIFIGGASSGAITTLKLAAASDCPSVLGVIDMWGAVERLDLLDSCGVALIAFHGDKDKTVPYEEGWPMGGKSLMSYMYGSKPLTEHLVTLGRDAKLVVFEGYEHAPYRDKDHGINANYAVLRDEILSFVRKFVYLRP